MDLNTIGNLGTLIALILLAVLFWYIITNIEAFTENPCKVCEEKVTGMKCVPMVKGLYVQEEEDDRNEYK